MITSSDPGPTCTNNQSLQDSDIINVDEHQTLLPSYFITTIKLCNHQDDDLVTKKLCA